MNLANPSCRNIQEWVTHLNDRIKYLTFCIIEQSHMVHFVDFLISIDSTVTQKGFYHTTRTSKVQCIVAYDLIALKLKRKFLDHDLMNDLRIIYPQYWL
jgi:hypothetical protein